MSSVPVLYHGESSFFSQRARLAFAEKGIRYKSYLVNMMAGEMHSPWYMRTVNPKGAVPALEHLGKFYTDSLDIIEYVDTLPSDKPKLCPIDNSEVSARVCHFRDLLNSINVGALTYGSVYNKHLTTKPMFPSFLSNEKVKERVINAEKHLDDLKAKNPDIAQGLATRTGPGITDLKDIIFSEERTLALLNQVDGIMAEIEEELQKRKAEYGDAEYWLCSNTFTIADIFLSCLLHRITYIGQAERLFLSRRPLTTDYYQRVLKRKSFKKECVYANSAFWSIFLPMLRAGFKRTRPFIFGFGVTLLGVLAYYRKDEIRDFTKHSFDALSSRFGSMFPSLRLSK